MDTSIFPVKEAGEFEHFIDDTSLMDLGFEPFPADHYLQMQTSTTPNSALISPINTLPPSPSQLALHYPPQPPYDIPIDLALTQLCQPVQPESWLYPESMDSELLGASPSTSNAFGSASEESWEPEDVHIMGYQDENGDWRCKHEACTSSRIFLRACDLRKHYRAHYKLYFCSNFDCVRFSHGFSSQKDKRRHEASHSPRITCPAEGCSRIFSRLGMWKCFFPSSP